tara:strand:+ start:82 stop:309 length:228 start_codon:yes stop_codon:yes gene_type:complete
MNKLIKKIGVDKILHFLVGACVYFTFDNLWVVIVIALLKELLDEKTYGGFDLVDFLITVLGGIMALLIIILKTHL